MKIGVEMRGITAREPGGQATLLQGVLRALFAEHPDDDYVVFCTPFNRALLEGCSGRVQLLTCPLTNYFVAVDRLAAKRRIDVLIRACPTEEKLAFPLRRQVVFVPDVRHEVHPEWFAPDVLRSLRLSLTQALRGAGALAVPSPFVRAALLRHRDTQCRDIFLMPPAAPVAHADADRQVLSDEEEALLPQEDYFLYPADLRPHKNHTRLLEAFARFLRQTGRRMSLVLTGPQAGWEALRAAHPDLPVRHLGFVSVPLLRGLYRRARALVYFSCHEDIGLPILEAFDAGTPVLCGDTGSLPEMGGDALLRCNPLDPAAMSALMARITGDESLRAELVTRGCQRLRLYDWRESARNLHDACHHVGRVPLYPRPVAAALTPERLPLVSIVTPSFNQGRFLRRTIESVLNQTYPNIEYLVMDGGSTDDSVAILKSYGDRFPWVSERDRGQTDAINKGFARSRGVLRAYLNSDDVLLPHAVDRAVTHFLRNPDCDLVYGRANYIDACDRVIGTYPTVQYSFVRMVFDCCICQPAAFWTRRIAEQIGPFDDGLHYAMDFDYWLRIDRAGGRIEFCPETFACSRLYAETKTLSARPRVFHEIFAVSQRHAGYVDLNYFHGFWRHQCEERTSGLPRRFAACPGFLETMAFLHHLWWHQRHDSLRLWWHQRQGSIRRVLGNAGRILKHGVLVGIPPLAPVFAPVRSLYARVVKPRLLPPLGRDNWLGPACTIALPTPAAGHVWHLGGIPCTDMHLTVKAGGRLIGTYRLRGRTFENIRFTIPDTGLKLSFKFSKYRLSRNRRRVSFLVQDTNLFCEQDVA